MKAMEATARAIDEASLLDDLRQVPGVLGAMLVDSEGALRLQRLPSPFAARAQDAAPRLAVLLDALAAGRGMHCFCLRFLEHRLHVLPTSSGFLCVLSELWGPVAMLKMAMNVAAKRIYQ